MADCGLPPRGLRQNKEFIYQMLGRDARADAWPRRKGRCLAATQGQMLDHDARAGAWPRRKGGQAAMLVFAGGTNMMYLYNSTYYNNVPSGNACKLCP
ncbi:hypothetical protein KL86DES1_10830 [uncultured Desulfovibrio sp.]|uniref:Uncharacterized protein n=1 Tax=uncultured Desulfovibrio sp. TaxID=167968 RepID=A0A212L0G7_9BACT|nr:hypothetical protein KL86DES1_10830 [uncultured Desulfovibrio sp.]VZH32703.1 conserved protein of unknown function [Desulfovibrio sp. 86]